MLVTESGIVTLVSPLQPSNAYFPTLVTLLGIIMLVKPLQPSNAEFPMLVTPLPIVTLVKPLQSLNAESPMLVTLSGIVTLVKPLQPRNALNPMLVTLYPPSVDGIVIAPVVVLGIAGVEIQPTPERTDAAPLTTVYVHVMPSTVAV